MIQDIYKDLRGMWKRKKFLILLPFVAVMSFLTLLLNPTVGIDDTAFDIYFEQGVAPAVGRWCLYLIHKILPLGYNPFFMEAVGIIIFCVSASLWCLAFWRVFGEDISDWGYLLFACVMVSSPITAEVVVYYLHNGIFIAYGACALAVLAGMEFLRNREQSRMSKVQLICISVMGLTVALGCYESFMVVYLMGMMMVYFAVRMKQSREFSPQAFGWGAWTLMTAVGSLLCRGAIMKVLIKMFGLYEETQVLNVRGIHEFFGWFDGTRSFEDFVYVMKEFLVKYYINGVVYLPIGILVVAVAVLFLVALVLAVRYRDGMIFAVAMGIILLPWVMPILEGSATFYRSCQYIPLLTGFAVLILSRFFFGKKEWDKRKRLSGRVIAILMGGMLYQQVYEMNSWLYLDALKYQDTVRTLEAVAYSLMQCDNPQKPVCIVGEYPVPESLAEKSVCPSWSKKYKIVEFMVKALDEELWEAYHGEDGYVFAETPRLSALQWGMTAFYGFDRQIMKLFEMQGYTFTEDADLQHYQEAREEMEDAPCFPAEGSVVEKQDFIIVNLG